MPSLKTNILIALAIGAMISVGLFAIEGPTDFAFLSLEMPGLSAAFLFWGAVDNSAFAGIVIAWMVNALVYGTGAFALISLGKLLRR